MSAPIYLTTLGLFFGAVILVFVIRYVSLVLQARARLANDDAHRTLAEGARTAQADTAKTLAAIQASMADVQGRLAAVEKILKDVG